MLHWYTLLIKVDLEFKCFEPRLWERKLENLAGLVLDPTYYTFL